MPAREHSSRLNRRDLLAGSVGAACAASTGILPAGGFFTGGSDRIRLGLIGCGGRGTGAASQAAAWHPSVRIVAMGDLFADHLAESARLLQASLGDRFECPSERQFVGDDAWRDVMGADLDAVILAGSSWTRPTHFAAAIARGLHVYCERPAAVDVEGMRTVRAAASDATRRGLVVVSGLAGRHHAATIDTVARIRDGGIGHPVLAICKADLGLAWHRPMRSSWTAEEYRHRNWVTDSMLAGGLLVETHLDALDRGLWAMGDACPVAAIPAASRQGLAVRYRFAHGRELHAEITRSAGATGQREETVRGPRGVADLVRHEIVGRQAWQADGSPANPWQVCMGGFVDAIRSGSRGDGGQPLIRSNLVALLGRTALETGREVAWSEVAGPSGGATVII